MAQQKGKLLFFCGKMAAGKSTLSRQLASQEGAVLLVEDEFLERLFPGRIADLAAYVTYSSRVREALSPLIVSLLSMGVSVVLDFPGNTRRQRAWFRRLIDDAGAGHELHFIDATDTLCLRQLRERSQDLPPESRWTSEAEFQAVTAYFEPPAADEGFHVVRHERA
ncbi:MAG TPA: ATP-binding protein [Thermoanaerobaculia bacterium]|nr:ATP-binding protein [Thermoanaerobaculia bacterium]